MKYEIYYQGNVIASFMEKEDAEHFRKWKVEQELSKRKGQILDQIAEENGLDRSFPGAFPYSIISKYYKAEKMQLEGQYQLKTKVARSVRKKGGMSL